MVSSVNSSGSDYIQKLLAQMMKNSSAQGTDSTTGITKEDLASATSKTESSGKSGTDFLKLLSENFDKIDSNQDGELSKDELKAFKPPHPPAMGPPPGLSIEDFVTSSDTDGKDGLSLDELSSIDTGDDKKAENFVKKMTQNFDKIDTNQDGQISADEIEAAKPQGPPLEEAATEQSRTTTASSDSTSSDSESSLESKVGKLSDFFIKQLLNAYEKSGSNLTTNLASDLTTTLSTALDIAV